MSVRTKMLGFVDVILRVPPIFIIDEILKIGMGIPFSPQNTVDMHNGGVVVDPTINNQAVNGTHTNDKVLNETAAADLFGSSPHLISDNVEFYQILSLTSLKFFSCVLGKWRFNVTAIECLARRRNDAMRRIDRDKDKIDECSAR